MKKKKAEARKQEEMSAGMAMLEEEYGIRAKGEEKYIEGRCPRKPFWRCATKNEAVCSFKRALCEGACSFV